MTTTKLKIASLIFAAFGIAALLGGSLGVVTAGQKQTLFAGSNPAVGGPFAGSVTPAKWVSCLPSSSWRAVYRWDGTAQQWGHFFNTTKGIPSYVNHEDVGGRIGDANGRAGQQSVHAGLFWRVVPLTVLDVSASR